MQLHGRGPNHEFFSLQPGLLDMTHCYGGFHYQYSIAYGYLYLRTLIVASCLLKALETTSGAKTPNTDYMRGEPSRAEPTQVS